ncbi:MAG: SUF system NifU family Fe-S cluster assembly protein [Cytophagales bacterium]|jgi:nitrogen fixation NifU-like protein|nr:SUF system NifU family Fe-S cluster assembly protein [Cytophagales bacterium]
MSSDIEYLYQTIILEHAKNPQNQGLTYDSNYEFFHLNNPSCGDEINLEILLEDEVIKDVRQEGHGCAISRASASIVSELLKGLKVDEALRMIEDFYEIVQGKILVDEEKFGDALVMRGVNKFPVRIKCATLAWKACEQILKKKKI